MKTVYYSSTRPEQKEVTNIDILKAFSAVAALLFISTVLFSNVIGKLLELLK